MRWRKPLTDWRATASLNNLDSVFSVMDEMNNLELASYIAVVAGALNWIFTGLGMLSEGSRTVYNPVYRFANAVGVPEIESVFYLLVGFAALYQIYFGYRMYQ